jgi:type I restriction enzyme R subunit
MSILNESTVELAALEYLRQLGFSTAFGPEIAVDGERPERHSYDSVYLYERLRKTIVRLNSTVSTASIDEIVKRLERAESQNPIAENMRVHELLRDGVPAERRDSSGQVRTELIQLVDFEHPENNDWLAVNQFTVDEGRNRRPDIVLFLNGIPVALFELKNLADEKATLRHAFNQIQTYRKDIPSIFTPNVATVISDGTSAAMSSFSGQFEHYAPWKTVEGREVVTSRPALEVLIKGVFEQSRFLDLLQNFVVFSDEGNNGLIKRVAKPASTVGVVS